MKEHIDFTDITLNFWQFVWQNVQNFQLWNVAGPETRLSEGVFMTVFMCQIVVISIVFWVIFFFQGAIWPGTIAAALMFGLAWYGRSQMKQIQELDPGMSSYDYLKAFSALLQDLLKKNIVVMRFFYPLFFMTALSVMWFSGNNREILTTKFLEMFPGMSVAFGLPIIVPFMVGIATFLISFFSEKIFSWENRLMYGGFLSRLEETIAGMGEEEE